MTTKAAAAGNDGMRTALEEIIAAVPPNQGGQILVVPDAAGRRGAIIEECAAEANGIDPTILKRMSESHVSLYCQSRMDAVNAILALKPRDTGDNNQ